MSVREAEGGGETITLREYIEALNRQHTHAHSREHELLSEGVEKAEKLMSARLDGTKGEMDVKFETFDKRLNTLERGASNLEGRFWSMGIGFTILVIVINIALRFLP